MLCTEIDLRFGLIPWLVRAWVQRPFATISADIPRGWLKHMTFCLRFGLDLYIQFWFRNFVIKLHQ